MENLNLQELRDEVDHYLYDFQEISVNSQTDYQNAADIAKQLQFKAKKIEEKRLEYTKPLDESKKRIMADFKALITPIDEVVGRIKSAMLEWHKKEQIRLNEEQKKLEAAALEQATKEGQSVVAVPVVNDIKTQRGNISTATIRKVWKYRIIDELKIPREYLAVDTTKINYAVRAGIRKIEGIEIYQEEQAPTIR